MLAEQLQEFFALAIGFAIAGLMATGYQLVTQRPPSFRQLQEGPRPATFAALPVLIFAAPFIIMRNTIRLSRAEGRTFAPVMMATIVAGCWSLMSGTVVLMGLTALVPPI
jgi:Family of unknown function (DUF6949)